MKRLMYPVMLGLALLVYLPELLFCAQTTSKQTLPQVPVTYTGDTEKTIIRRAQWIEEAKKEGTLNFWSSSGAAEVKELMADFKKIYPFIKVDHWRGQEAERNVKLETEYSSGRVTVDIFDAGAPAYFPRWRKMGILGKYTDFIPGIEKWDKRTVSKYGDWGWPEHTPLTPTYNTKSIPVAEVPMKWEDLLDPKWKGQIGITADMKAWFMLALGEKGWGIEKTEDYLAKLKQQQLIFARGHSAGQNLLKAGEFKIFAEDSIRTIFLPSAKGIPVDWVRVNPVPVSGSAYILANKGPHPNAARLFIEWFLSPHGLATIERVTGKSAIYPGSGAKLAKVVEGLDLIFLNEDIAVKANDLGLIEKFAKILGVTPRD